MTEKQQKIYDLIKENGCMTARQVTSRLYDNTTHQSICFSDNIIDFVENGKNGCIFFVNDQKPLIEKLHNTRIVKLLKQSQDLNQSNSALIKKLEKTITENDLKFNKLKKLNYFKLRIVGDKK